MQTMIRRAGIIASGSLLALLGFTAPGFAEDDYEPPKPPERSACNAGNGNGSEAATEDCEGGDPGNSFDAGNRGGDEIPTSGGVPNPGGNNVP
jgi:hypothetical protein